MGPFGLAFIIGSVLSAGAAINSSIVQADAAEKQEGQRAASANEQRMASTRKRIRERRIQEARIRQQAANTGVGGSSGELGALSSLSSQFATGVSADQFAIKQSEDLGRIQSDLARGQQQSNLIGAVGDITKTGAMAGQQGMFK